MAHNNWKQEIPADEIRAQISTAKAAWVRAASTEPQAESVSFNPQEMSFTIKLSNSVLFIFSSKLIKEISEAQLDQLSDVHLSGAGDSIHWEALDVDFSIPGLIHRLAGTKACMSELGREGGKNTSLAKTEAARQNGKKGGRPKKRSILN